MIRRIIAIIIAVSLLNGFIGCTCANKMPVDEVEIKRDGKIERVFLKSGEIVEFDEDGGQIDQENQIIKGYIDDEELYGTLFEYKFEEIETVQYRAISTTNSILSVMTVVALGAALWNVTFGD
jgi:hypothetical protein